MIELAKTSTKEIVDAFLIKGEKVSLVNDKIILIHFAPLAKALSNELIALKINNTYSFTDSVGYVELHGSASQLEVIEYKFNLNGDRLLFIEKITHSVQIDHENGRHEK